MKRLLALLVTLVAAWLGAAPGAAAVPAAPVLSHTYDTSHLGAPTFNTPPERGLPNAYERGVTHHTVGRWASGAVTRPEADTPRTATSYDGPLQLVQLARGLGTTKEELQGTSRQPDGFDRSGVAANTGSRLAEASSSAFRAADNVGDFTVSAKHLPGAGGRWNKWAEGVDINGTIASALRSDAATFLPNASGAADSFIVRTNVGSIVGTKGQTYVKAVISNNGRIITAYPVK